MIAEVERGDRACTLWERGGRIIKLGMLYNCLVDSIPANLLLHVNTSPRMSAIVNEIFLLGRRHQLLHSHGSMVPRQTERIRRIGVLQLGLFVKASPLQQWGWKVRVTESCLHSFNILPIIRVKHSNFLASMNVHIWLQKIKHTSVAWPSVQPTALFDCFKYKWPTEWWSSIGLLDVFFAAAAAAAFCANCKDCCARISLKISSFLSN